MAQAQTCDVDVDVDSDSYCEMEKSTSSIAAASARATMPFAAPNREKPLELLDLPEDILQAILREVTFTNDLTALALTHSVLHDLVIPHIYSRFDIVWPEANSHIESRVGVDALTYGLATLVMANDVFGETQHEQRPHEKHKRDPRRIRRGNHFAEYTKKFSLGNGPNDWVSEYLITKEGGKMLGTLVALAVGRMRNLETFVWDMPTGVLRDVWLALASLGVRNDGKDCRLQKVWVRWHDNTEGSPIASPPPPSSGPGQQLPPSIPAILAGTANALFQVPPYPRVEFPSFSILPPLRSLTVLDIDEISYVEEMSVLIEKSLHTLRELRVGVADHAQYDPWTTAVEERSLVSSSIHLDDRPSQYRGGILGILIHRFCAAGQASKEGDESADHATSSKLPIGFHQPVSQNVKETVDDFVADDVDQIGRSLLGVQLEDSAVSETPTVHVSKRRSRATHDFPAISTSMTQQAIGNQSPLPKKMQLDSLDLERVFLSVSALSRGLNWSRLTSLTLLGCRNHEQLWKELRRKFAPPSRGRSSSGVKSRKFSSSLGSTLSPRNSTPTNNIPREEYRLKITHLHTDTVSHAFIAFIKEGLAPDSLEWLFLQDNSTYKSTVTIDTIYKGAIRPHRRSLRKLLIDSDSRKDDERPASWRKWVLNREILECLTSGKMRLRELSLSIDYKDWHYFLQRLPQLKTLRSLHIIHTANHVQREPDTRETALQVSDIVSLRPELELCYLGVQQSCYEILECMTQQGASPNRLTVVNPSHDPNSEAENDDTIEEEDGDEGDSDNDVDFSHGEETEDEGETSPSKVTFRLREILFYDDKISIFRARHGRL